MKIVSTFHRPSSVVCSLKCRLTSASLEHLVVAKLDGIDVYAIQPQGLKYQTRWDVWGNILCVKAVPTSDRSRANLLVLLDHPEPELIFLTYTQSGGIGKLTVTKRLDLVEHNHNQRPAEFYNDVIVHPGGKLAIVSCYTGKLKGIVLKTGNYVSDFDASIADLVIFSIAFLPSPDEYSIALLCYDHTRRIQLYARTVLSDDISRHLSAVLHPTPISSKTLPYPEDAIPKLIPVPRPQDAEDVDPENESESFIGGVLVVGGTRILLFEMASAEGQAKQRNKRRKLERGRESENQAEKDKARQKQNERDTRKRKPKAFVDWPWSEVTSCCAIEGEPVRYLIGDCFGRLAMLSLHDVPNNGLVLIPLGETSPSTTLTYLTNQILYVGSHAGDSQLLQISSMSSGEATLPIPLPIETVPAARLAPPPSDKGKGREEDIEPLRDCVLHVEGTHLRVLESFKNIAPILDATLVDTDNSGHRQIVTCSGGQNTGSINVMRKGADFQQLAIVAGMAYTVGLFALRRTYDNIFDSHVLVSTLEETHAFEFKGNDTLERVEPLGVGFAPGRTLAARNVQRVIVHEANHRTKAPERVEYSDTPLVVQVTSDGAYLLEFEMETFNEVVKFDVTKRGHQDQTLQVVAADINPSQVVLALNNGNLLCLEVSGANKTLSLRRQSDTILGHREVSALSCTPLDPMASASEFVVVAYWQTKTIEILEQAKDRFVSVRKSAPLRAVVRSLLLYDFGTADNTRPYLLAGLGDGSFAYFTWNEHDRFLGEPKLMSLGNLPVSFTPCSVDGKKVLFAAGSRAMVLSWEQDHIHSSPVMLKEVMAATQFHNENYESALILANESALFLGQVRDVDKMHIRSIPLGLDAPQRIVYEPSLKVFGVACTRREPTRVGTAEPAPKSSFRLLDDTTFNLLSQFNCDADEELTCVTACTLEQDGDSTAFFCLGSYMFSAEESEPKIGRILVFSAYPPGAESRSSSIELSLTASVDVEGCVYAITTVKGLLAAGVNSAVMLFRLEVDPATNRTKLHNLSKINLNYFVTSLASYEDRLVLGDQISSLSLLEITGESKLVTLGRDLTPLSPVAVQLVDRDHVIAANDTLNLLSFTLDNVNKKLERDGFYQQSDLITKLIPGSITASDPGSQLKPLQMFFASSGRIGVIIDITERQLGLDLTDLQRNMAGAVEGGHYHTRFRSPQSTARRRVAETAYGFLDGDFLERMLTAPPAQLVKIVEGSSEPERLKRPLDDMQQVLKTLQALH
ncbi:mono-functional DNA-alkylating methyl methanesulfonate N-term-domain-containing protein [Mycena pura]|uniref:Mono-functional DNA-alkylating methyl methanesulfonate N-term-domain-containing protein n=1 Tax=Mycena pura TaxID=153505 RepID=A0AAD6Y8V3_9AGAR|nr:mono-functional DNA-alkylating methyl methanesulfonate N-term-domain-containing protein [Mycena pura]